MKTRGLRAVLLSLALLSLNAVAEENSDFPNLDLPIAEEQVEKTQQPAEGEQSEGEQTAKANTEEGKAVAKGVQKNVEVMMTSLNESHTSLEDPRVQKILQDAGIKIEASGAQRVLVIRQKINPNLVTDLEQANEGLQEVAQQEEIERKRFANRVHDSVDQLNQAAEESGINYEKYLEKHGVQYKIENGVIIFTDEPSEEFITNIQKVTQETREKGQLKAKEKQLLTELDSVDHIGGGGLLEEALKKNGINYEVVDGEIKIKEELSPEYIARLKVAQGSLRTLYIKKKLNKLAKNGQKSKEEIDRDYNTLIHGSGVHGSGENRKLKPQFSGEVIAGYLAGTNTSTGVGQIKAKFLPVAGVKIGPQLILGTPENGFNMFHSKQKIDFLGLSLGSTEGALLGYTYNSAKKKHKFTLASAKGKAAVNRWLNLGTGVDIGVVNYKKEGSMIHFTPSIGAEAHGKLGRVDVLAVSDLSYEFAEANAVLSCRGEASTVIFDNDSINLSAAAVGKMNFESSPMSYGNPHEIYGGVVIGGEFK